MFKRFFARAAGACVAALVFSVTPATVRAADAAGDDPVIATVNGIDITRSEVVRAQKSLPEQYRSIPLEMIMPNLVDSVIDGHLVAKYAIDNDLKNTDEYKTEIRRLERQILQSMALNREIDMNVTDAAVRGRFDEMVAKVGETEEVHARHILLKTEDEAKAIIAELDKGADFAELAKQKSTDPSASSGGDLGFFGRGQMVPAFEQAAFELEKGTWTPVAVKTQFGFHVIRTEDRRTAVPPTFEEQAPRIREELAREVAGAFIKKIRGAAKIEKFLERAGSPVQPEKKTDN